MWNFLRRELLHTGMTTQPARFVKVTIVNVSRRNNRRFTGRLIVCVQQTDQEILTQQTSLEFSLLFSLRSRFHCWDTD
jgi:hypothetical protein